MMSILERYVAEVSAPRILAAWLATSICLTISGPFGTYVGQMLGERAIY